MKHRAQVLHPSLQFGLRVDDRTLGVPNPSFGRSVMRVGGSDSGDQGVEKHRLRHEDECVDARGAVLAETISEASSERRAA